MKSSALIFILFSLLSLKILANDAGKLSSYSMKYSIETTASKSTIWRLWTDVENWKVFDERLEYSYLVGGATFDVGAIGYVKGQGAPKTKFELMKVDQGNSFTEVLKLPLYQTVHLQRYFEASDEGKTIFTHEVTFKGGLKSVYYGLFGGAFKKDLPLVMEKLKNIAEAQEQKIRLL